MGYRGKLAEREAARALRAEGLTLQDIATRLGVSKSSASLWTRDVVFTPQLPFEASAARRRGPNTLQRRKEEEIAQLRADGRRLVGQLSDRELFMAGIALYAGEGAKTGGAVKFANSDPALVAFFVRWLRRYFDVDEARLRVRLYLHEGLDLQRAEAHWVAVTNIPPSQFSKPYRAVADQSLRRTKHVHGCATVGYSCSRTLRAILGLTEALFSAGPG